ncbi:MAG TPA: hypothetical protein VHX60_18070 [Acidobacteriaceae bacterium]|nr:hypothetical protein [Acidobacteriaceae bacterium]
MLLAAAILAHKLSSHACSRSTAPQIPRRTLESMAISPDSSGKRDSEATPRGPSWGLMLALIALAMLLAIGIAWAFIHPMLHPH